MTAAERAKGRYMRAPDHDDVEPLPARSRPTSKRSTTRSKRSPKRRSLKPRRAFRWPKRPRKSPTKRLIGMNEAKARLDELEQKVAPRREDEADEAKSLGERFTDSEEVKDFLDRGGKGRVSVDRAEGHYLGPDHNASRFGRWRNRPDRQPGVQGVANRPLRVRDLLMPGRTNSNADPVRSGNGVHQRRGDCFGNGRYDQAAVRPAARLQTSNVTTIAHWVQATRQILSDVPMLQSYINGRLMYGLRYVEDNQLLNGAGTGTDLNGIYTQATASTANLAVIAARRRSTCFALQSCRRRWRTFRRAASCSTRPIGRASRRTRTARPLPGRRSAEPRSAAAVGPSGRGNSGHDGGQVPHRRVRHGRADLRSAGCASVEISTEDGNNFVKNLVTILCEERLALAVYNTLAFVKGDFAAQITDLTS
jgi:hypothetical protein